MNYLSNRITLTALLLILLYSCTTAKKNQHDQSLKYKPDDQQLYDTIVKLDSIFFDAYNTCSTNLEKYSGFYSDSIEFYHDKGGIMTSKKDIIDGTKKYICGKVTREVLKETIEVYPIKNYGAVEFGYHKFHNNEQPAGTPSKAGRFMIIWHIENNQWKISRVVSLH